MTIVLHNVRGSNIANAMIKYIVAVNARRVIGDAILSNYKIEMWNISHPAIAQESSTAVDFIDDQHINFEKLRYLTSTGMVSRVNLHGHLQRMENLLGIAECSALFSAEASIGISFGEEFLVCPVRGGEILDARHPGYTLIPIEFYREIFLSTAHSSLTPVFMGQIDPNPYSDALRKEFPKAVFLPSLGALFDFQTIRKAKNIIVPISTFAWLAAWLSDAKHIILPVYGLFNPLQYPDHDLIPFSDPRYRFYRFSAHEAVKVEDAISAHRGVTWSIADRRFFLDLALKDNTQL